MRLTVILCSLSLAAALVSCGVKESSRVQANVDSKENTNSLQNLVDLKVDKTSEALTLIASFKTNSFSVPQGQDTLSYQLGIKDGPFEFGFYHYNLNGSASTLDLETLINEGQVSLWISNSTGGSTLDADIKTSLEGNVLTMTLMGDNIDRFDLSKLSYFYGVTQEEITHPNDVLKSLSLDNEDITLTANYEGDTIVLQASPKLSSFLVNDVVDVSNYDFGLKNENFELVFSYFNISSNPQTIDFSTLVEGSQTDLWQKTSDSYLLVKDAEVSTELVGNTITIRLDGAFARVFDLESSELFADFPR